MKKKGGIHSRYMSSTFSFSLQNLDPSENYKKQPATIVAQAPEKAHWKNQISHPSESFAGAYLCSSKMHQRRD